MKTKSKAKSDFLKFLMQLFMVIFSGAISGIVFRTFFQPNKIVPTGFSGLSVIIHNLLMPVIDIPTSIIYLIFNILIFAFAFKVFGPKFIILSLFGVASYTVAMHFGYFPNLASSSSETLLFVIIGGVLSGASVGIAMKFGGSTGGSDVAGLILNKYFPKIKTGFVILIINAIVLILSIIFNGIQTALYTIILIVLSAMATNLVLDNSKRIVSFYIICDNDQEIADAIMKTFHRGVTKIDAVGASLNKKKKIILCLVPFQQAADMKKLINKIDENAFVYSTPVDETMGEKNFAKIFSINKNRIRKAKPIIKKLRKKVVRHENMKKLKYPKRKTRFYAK